MPLYFVAINTTADPDVVTVDVSKRIFGGAIDTEKYDAPASVLTDDLIIMNLVKLSRMEVGLVPIKPK